jgi:hypothetical protein
LVEQVLDADERGDAAAASAVVVEALLFLRQSSSASAEPDRHTFLSLAVLARRDASLFGTEAAVDALIALLRRDASGVGKRNGAVAVLACSILWLLFRHQRDWPLELVQVRTPTSACRPSIGLAVDTLTTTCACVVCRWSLVVSRPCVAEARPIWRMRWRTGCGWMTSARARSWPTS